MCGIAGIAVLNGPPPAVDELDAMCRSLMHRGPDEAGRLMDGSVALGMRRLSIIDLTGGSQPIFNEDRTVAVVCNGEIYNYRALRAWLETEGHRFTTASDTEVLVHLWEQVGIEFPRWLDGMFAIALYDSARRRLVLARDHVGIKPLYFLLDHHRLVFGSEVKALLATDRVSRRLDVDSLGQLLAWEYVPGRRTLVSGIERLEPASTLELDLATGRHTLRRYWDARGERDPEPHRSTDAWEEEIDAAIRRNVRAQLVSDVPLGAFLSGGVDSSLVVAAMGEATTFSIGFDDPSYDETRWSRRVAAHLGVDHRVEIIRPDVRGLFDRLMLFMDDPIGDFSIFPTFLVSDLARRSVKVVLTGDGGDELFGGYETYLAEENARLFARLPHWMRAGLVDLLLDHVRPTSAKKGVINKAKRFVEGARLDPALGHARWRMFCDDMMRKSLFTADAVDRMATPSAAHILTLREHGRDLDPQSRNLYVDFRSYLVDNCLAKVDRMSMAASLEARVPLLARELVELAFRMPSSLKYDRRRTKILLKRIAARYVPPECVYRPKEGFSIPMKQWLTREFRDLVEMYLAPDRLRVAGLFQPETVQRLWHEHLEQRANHSHLLWSMLVFEQWRDRWGVTT